MATDQQAAGAARDVDPYLLDRRLTILETRFDTILPTLATKADLAELRAELKAEIRAESAKMSAESGKVMRWVAATLVTVVLGFAGMIVTLVTVLPH
jgi:hypothetical protein